VTACAQGVKHVAMCECGLHMVQPTWQQDSKLRAFAYVWILPPSSVHKPAWLAHYMQHQLTPMGSLAALLTFTAHLMQHQPSSLSLHISCSTSSPHFHCTIKRLICNSVHKPLRLTTASAHS
jgi:hypothetical protein